MRIIGTIPHPIMKITVMQMNERFVVKLETNQLEQTYKFNEDDRLRNMADIESMLDDNFLNECLDRFVLMNQSRGEMYQRFSGS